MELSLTTPALLFPAVSLLLLAYTNRFLTLSQLIRDFNPHEQTDLVVKQIRNLRQRMKLIRWMQEFGGISFFFCVCSMLAMYFGYQQVGNGFFALSLTMLLLSLWMSIREIHISLRALEVHLKQFDLEKQK